MVTQNAGRTALQKFAPITSSKYILVKLAEWSDMMHRFGSDIGPDFSRTMLLEVLPDGLRNDVMKDRTT